MNRLKLRDEIARIEQARRITKAVLWFIILAVVAVIAWSHPLPATAIGLGVASLFHLARFIFSATEKLKEDPEAEEYDDFWGVPHPNRHWVIGMGLGIAALMLFWSASCTVVNHPSAGYYASLGGDTVKMKADAAGYSFDSNSNSAAFRDVIKQVRLSWQSYLVAEGLKFLSGKYYDHEGKIVDSATTVKLEELRNAQTLAEGEQALQALKLSTP